MATAPTDTRVTSGPGVTHETEDLSDVIARIDPTEVPVYSGCSKGTATSIKHEWTVQALKAVDTENARNEGGEPDYEALAVPARYPNYTQIATRSGIVSGTYDSVDTVGSASRESTRQKVMAGLELRRDIERIITQVTDTNASPVDQVAKGTDPRRLGSFASWITNVSVGAGGAAPTGDGTDVPTVGTPRAFDTVGLIDPVLLDCYTNGGRPKVGYMTPAQKVAFSKQITDATAGGGSIYVTKPDTARSQFQFIGAADMYHSDWGPIEIAPSIHMAPGLVYWLDPNYMKICTLPGRNFQATDLAKTGDSTRFMVLWEGTVEATAPKAHGATYGLS
jgi:hypothetical protein